MSGFGGKTFYKYLITYSVVLAIPLLFLVYFYTYSAEILRRQYVVTGKNAIFECKTFLDTHISSLEQSITYFLSSDKVQVLNESLHPVSDPSSIIPIIELQEELKTFEFADGFTDFIEAICVNYFKSGLTIFPRDVLFSTDTNINITNLQHINMIDWRLYMKKRIYYRDYVESNYSLFESRSGEALFYINTFPLHSSQPRGTVAVFLKTDKLISLLEKSVGPGGFSYIIDGKGHVISSGGGGVLKESERFTDRESGSFIEEIEGEPYLTSFTTSNYNDWKIIASVPYSDISDYVRTFRVNLILAIFMCFLVGMVFSFYFARRISQPIDHISSLINQHRVDLNDENMKNLVEIEHSLKNIFTDSSSLHHRIDMQHQLLRSSFFRRLLGGAFTDEEEIRKYMESLNWEYLDKPQTLLCLSFAMPGVDENLKKEFDFYHLAVVYMNNYLLSSYDRRFFLYLMESGLAVLILETGERDNSFRPTIKSLIVQLEKEINRIGEVRLFAGVGSTVKGMTDLYCSYDKARTALSRNEGRIVSWSKDCRGCDLWYYPPHVENRLFNNLRIGNLAGLEEVRVELAGENWEGRILNETAAHRFLTNLEFTLIKALENMFSRDEEDLILHRLHQLGQNPDVRRRYEDLFFLMGDICEKVTRERGEKNTEQADRLHEYLKENYFDTQLTITMAAKQFELSEGYFSRLFKQIFKETFSSYLEKIRIEQACLKLGTEGKIDDIARECGYNSSSVFRRAFKRIKGVTPHEYRKSLSD